MFAERINSYEEKGRCKITSLEFDTLNQCTEVTNQCLSAAVHYDESDTKFEKFALRDFVGLEKVLNESIIDSAVMKLDCVQHFTVAHMSRLPEEVRKQLLQFASSVLEKRSYGPRMTAMNFNGLINDRDGSDADGYLIDTMVNSG